MIFLLKLKKCIIALSTVQHTITVLLTSYCINLNVNCEVSKRSQFELTVTVKLLDKVKTKDFSLFYLHGIIKQRILVHVASCFKKI